MSNQSPQSPTPSQPTNSLPPATSTIEPQRPTSPSKRSPSVLSTSDDSIDFTPMASRTTSRTRTAEMHDSIAHLLSIFSSSEDGCGCTIPALDILLRESIPRILEGQQVLAEGMRKLNQRVERLEKVERFVDFWDTPGRMVSQADIVDMRDGLNTQIKENHKAVIDALSNLLREPQRPSHKPKPSNDIFATPNPRRKRAAPKSSMRTRTPGPTHHKYSDESVYSFHSRRTSPERVGRDPSTEPHPSRLRTTTIKAESPEPTRDWRSTAAPEERKTCNPLVRPLAASRQTTTGAPHRPSAPCNSTAPAGDDDAGKSKMPRPAAYEGKRGLPAKQFFTQCLAYFDLFPKHFRSDRKKIKFILTSMGKGVPGAWAQPLLSHLVNYEPHPHISDLKSFQNAFLLNFGDPVAARAAERKIREIQQKGPASEYATEFRTIAAELDIDDRALQIEFRRGLKDHVRLKLAEWMIGREPPNLESLITAAISIDDALFEARRLSTHATTAPSGSNTRASAAVLVPEEEKTRRMKEGACIKCGGKGHRTAVCRTGWKYAGKGEEKRAMGKIAEASDSSSESGKE